MIRKVTIEIGKWEDGSPKRTTRIARLKGKTAVDHEGQLIEGTVVASYAATPSEVVEFIELEDEACGMGV